MFHKSGNPFNIHLLICVSFLLMINFSNLFSQEIEVEKLMTKKIPDCRDISFNSTLLIPEYYRKNQFDTLSAILDYWEKQCGINEPILRLKILLAIKNNALNENMYDRSIIGYLTWYRDSKRFKEKGVDYYSDIIFWSRGFIDTGFNDFTRKIAKELKNKGKSPLESFFLDFYSDDFDKIFTRLNTKEFSGTKLKAYYLSELNEYTRKAEGHCSIYAGLWYPIGNIEIVGIHPLVGLQAGLKYKRLMVDFSLNFKFLNSAHTYKVFQNDSLWNTNHFFGGYFGIDAGLEIFRNKIHEFDLIGGIAYDGFDALNIKESKTSGKITKSINSLNFNIGLGYSFYFRSMRYLGIQAKYNFVNYENEKGTDLSGNTMEFYIILGFSGNNRKKTQLEKLDFIY